MLLTEEQAREKWCPFSKSVAVGTRENGSPYQSGNRVRAHQGTSAIGPISFPAQMNPETCRCIASDCMAWRWAMKSINEGYCGLAGKAKT